MKISDDEVNDLVAEVVFTDEMIQQKKRQLDVYFTEHVYYETILLLDRFDKTKKYIRKILRNAHKDQEAYQRLIRKFSRVGFK